MNDSIRSLILPKSDTAPTRNTEKMQGFFTQLASAKGRLQNKGKL